MMDFPFTPEGWQAIGSVLQGVGTVGGAVAVWLLARRAVSDWREQKQVENQIAAADRVLTECHNLCHFAFENFACLTLSHIESPVNWNDVEDDAKAKLVFETFERTQTFGTVEFMAKRRKLQECRNTALIYFGDEAARRIDAILEGMSQIHTLVFFTIFKDLEAKQRHSVEADNLSYAHVVRFASFIENELAEVRKQLAGVESIISAYIRKT